MDLSTVSSRLITFILISLYCRPAVHINAELPVEHRPKLANVGSNETLCEITTKSAVNTTLTISGGAHNCSVAIFTEGQVALQIHKTDFAEKSNFLFAAEYIENSVRIAQYVALPSDTLPPCRVVFSTNHIELNIRGNFQVELLYNQHLSPSSAFTSNRCTNIVTYDAVHTCRADKGTGVRNTICDPLCYSSSCKCTLAANQVTCEKFMIDMTFITTVTLLLYPRNISRMTIIANISSIQEGAFNGLETMSTLDLSYNELTILGKPVFRNLIYLHELQLGHNRLTMVTKSDFEGLTSLFSLSIASNRLTELTDDVFQNLKDLSWLDVSANNFLTISPKTFEGLSNLNTLYLTDNKLESIPENIFQNLTSLTEISLKGNRLKTLVPGTFRRLSMLYSLILDENALNHLPPGLFIGLENLLILSIKSNRIRTLKSHTFDGLDGLNTLILDNNNINNIEEEVFQGFKTLEHLFLSNNSLVSFQKHHVKEIGLYLSYLNLKNNSISEIEPGTFAYLLSLKTLLLQQNRIHELPSDISELELLQTFNISHNYLEVLPPLGNLRSLKTVDLRDNSLVHIKKGTFKGLTNQTKVYVDHEAICHYVSTGDSCTCLGTESVLPFFTGQPLLLSTSLSIFTWILGFGSLFGNTFVVVWRCLRQGDEDAVQSLLIMNLALSDLLMGMYLLIIASADAYFGAEFPLYSHKWVFAGGCDFAGILSVSSSEASVFFVTLISIDRYIRVVHPHTQYRLRIRSTYLSSLAIWAVAFLISVIPLVLKKTKDDFYDMSEVCIGLPLVKKPVLSTKSLHLTKSELPGAEYENLTTLTDSFYTTSTKSYVVVGLEVMAFSSTVFLGINLVCFIAVLYCYCAILHIVCKVSKKIKRSGGREREIRMAAKMAVIVLTDCFCWMPIIIMGVLVQAGAIVLSPVTIAWTVTFILPVNSSVNPYLYSIIAVLAKQIKETKDRRSFKLRSTNTACQTGTTNETAVSLCNLVGIGVKKKSIKGDLTECSAAGKLMT